MTRPLTVPMVNPPPVLISGIIEMVAPGADQEGEAVSVSVARGLRAVPRAVSVAAVSGLFVAAPAFAGGGGESYNNVGINIRGGDATAISKCVNIAKKQATYEKKGKYARAEKQKQKLEQLNFCEKVAVAEGGDVTLKDVDITIFQEDGSKKSVNNVTIKLRGGDAYAVSSCVNYAKGGGSVEQTNVCSGAKAQGGDVTLNNVELFIVQD